MRRYEYYLGDMARLSDQAMLVISEADPLPTVEELDEAEQLSRLLLLGDSSVRLIRSGRHPEIFHAVRVGAASFKIAA